MNKKYAVLASAVLALAMVLSMMTLPAMAGGESSADASDGGATAEIMTELPTDPTTFTRATISEPIYLDPAVDYGPSGGEVIMNTYETLVSYDGESAADLVPVLATEVPTIENGGISPDGMVYTFHIREGITFHDGTELTAEDVAYSVQRVLRIHDPDGPAWMVEQVMTKYLSFYIDGSTTVGSWAAAESVPDWLLEGAGLTDPDAVLTEDHNQAVAEFMVQTTGDMTVQMRLVKSYGGFLKICASTVMSILSQDYVEANGGIVNGQHNPVMDETVCGTGPYELAQWDQGVQMHLARNEEYWGPPPSLEDVYISFVLDLATRISMLQEGTVDTADIPLGYEYLFADEEFEVYKGMPEFDMTFMGFNMEINADEAAIWGGDIPADFFEDREVRQAFVNMFNYSVFHEMVLLNNAIQPNGPIPMGMFGYDPDVPAYEDNIEAARDHLRAAINPATGNSWWEDGFSIALFYNAGNTYREAACELLDAALYTLTIMAMGDTDAVFTAVVNALDWPTYLTMLRYPPSAFPMFYLGWSPDYADPDDYVTPFLHSVYGTFTHITNYNNPALNDMIEDAAVEVDVDLRAQMYSDISWLVHDEAPYLWLWQGCNFHVQRAWVDGYYHNPMQYGLDYASLSKQGVEPSEPVAAFTFDPDWPAAGMTVTFRAEGSYDEAGILSYSWSFGDGSSADGYEVTHVFDSAGRYTVTLTVTNMFGLEDSASQDVKVKGHAPCIYGTVVDSDLLPLEGATVRLYCDGSLLAKTTTDADGAFAFYGLEPDDYRVTAGMSGLGATSVYVMYIGDPVDVGAIVL